MQALLETACSAQMQDVEEARKEGSMPNKTQHLNDDIQARAIPRDQVDLRKLSRALIALAMAQAQAEADAEADHRNRDEEGRPRAA